MLLKDVETEAVDLTLEDCCETSSFEAKLEATYAGEEGGKA